MLAIRVRMRRRTSARWAMAQRRATRRLRRWLPSQGLAGRNPVLGAAFRGEAALVGETVAVGDLGDGVERRVGLTQVLVDTGRRRCRK